jgi:hypothetical protein
MVEDVQERTQVGGLDINERGALGCGLQLAFHSWLLCHILAYY